MLTHGDVILLVLAFVAVMAILTAVSVLPPAYRRVRATHAQQEHDAAAASGDQGRLDEITPWLAGYIKAAAEDAVNERAWGEAMRLANSHDATPIHDELAVARLRRELDGWGRL